MKNISLILSLLLILSACGETDKNLVTLNGHIEGLQQDTLYIYGVDQYHDQIDTLLLKEGEFSTTLKVDTLTPTRLLISDGTSYPLFLDKGNKLTIKGNSQDLRVLEIKGNQPNEEFTAFQKEVKGLQPAQKTEKAEAFIRSHPFSLVSTYLLDYYFVQQPQPNIKLIKELANSLSGELKDRPYLREMDEKLKQAERTEPGKSLPYFRMPNATGKSISRADYYDKHILLHFWASWDSISRKQNAMYRRIYRQESKNKHFILIGISLDIEPKKWKESLKQDTLKWEQLCDFSGWHNKFAEQLSVQTLPCNFLISPNGLIKGKNLDEKAILQKIKDIEAEEKLKKELKNKKRR